MAGISGFHLVSHGRKVLIPQDQYLLRVKERNSEAFPGGSTDTRVEPGTRESLGTDAHSTK